MNAYDVSLRDTDRKIQSLEDRKRELLEKVNDLRQRISVTSSTYIGNDLDVHGGVTTVKFKGSDEEIKEVDTKLAAIQKEIDELKASRTYRAEQAVREADAAAERAEKKEAKAEEKKRLEEEEKIMLFKDIKRAYTKSKGHGWDRFMATVSGRRPKWGIIKTYNIEELRYLDKASRGQTKFTTRLVESMESRMKDEDAPFAEIEKRKGRIRWNQFVHELTYKETLDLNMKNERSRKKR